MGTSCMETAPTATIEPTSATATPTSAPGLATLYTVAAATVSGVLLWMCFQPLSLGTYLGWFALAPFFVLVRTQSQGLTGWIPLERFLRASPFGRAVFTACYKPLVFLISGRRFPYVCATICGLAFFMPALQWMRVADRSMILGWIGLGLYLALYFPAALYGIRCLERWHVPLIVSASLVWIALEYFRSFAFTGFAWYLFAHTQHDLLPMIQITDIGGVFLVSFVVVAVNAFLFDCAYQFPEIRQWFNQTELAPYRTYARLEILNRGILAECFFRRNLIGEGAVLAVLLISTYSYGVMRLRQENFTAGPTVCLLQSNLDQRLREAAMAGNDDRSPKSVQEHFAELCVRASFNHQPKADLVIWPETSYPRPWVAVSPDLPIDKVPADWRDAEADIRMALTELAKNTKVPHLLGMTAHRLDDAGQHRRYNSALLLMPIVQPDGKIHGRIDGKFDKIHRLPFGEYLPLKDWLPFLSWLTPYEGDFGIQKGKKLTRFKLGKHHFGVLICFEDTDPFLARRYLESSDEGPPVDFLVNMSNDGWFDGSDEHEEHLAVSRFRAIECRRAMVRAVNMGVSAVIDSNGRVLKPKLYPDTNPKVWVVEEQMLRVPDLPVSEWHTFKKQSGIIKATVPIDHRFSFYAATGDWLPISCWLVLLTGAGWSCVRKRRVSA